MRQSLFLVFLAVLATGCNDTGQSKDLGLQPDVLSTDISYTPDFGGVACGPLVYPCGPYGTNTNDIAANLEFLGFADPKGHCKEHKDKVMDTSTMAKLAFKDWHLGDPSCASFRKDLLWVMVSAGWCGPCQNEVKQTQTQYLAGALDRRVEVLNIVFETTTPGTPADEAFTKQWISNFKLTYPVVMDPTFRMGAYFNKQATPFNMLVDTRTMKIFYRQTSGSLEVIGQQISAFFNK